MVQVFFLHFSHHTTDNRVRAKFSCLKKKIFDRISDALGGVVAGQFLQIENRINTLKDLRLELELPIIGG